MFTYPVLYSTVDLSPKQPDNPDYQFVYGSQLLGTFFGIFANFKTEAESKYSVKINSVSFGLINYKGVLNFGIKDVKYDKVNKCFKIRVSPMIDSMKTVDVSVDDTIKKGEFLVVEREYLPFKGTVTTPDYEFDTVFDEENYRRDGSANARIPGLPTINPSQDYDIEDFKNTFMYPVLEKLGAEKVEDSEAVPSPRCIRADLKVLF